MGFSPVHQDPGRFDKLLFWIHITGGSGTTLQDHAGCEMGMYNQRVFQVVHSSPLEPAG